MKNMPKSLHTVTVLVRLAMDFMVRTGGTVDEAIAHAFALLDYDELGQDVYGLGKQARKQIRAKGVDQ